MSFRKVAGSAQVANASIVLATQRVSSPSATAASVGDPSGGPRSPPGGQRIVIFCSDNEVTQTAVNTVALLARAGRDQVFLVTVVSSEVQQAQGSALVMRYYQELTQVLIQVGWS